MADGWVSFAGARWRVLLGGLGAWLTLSFVRSLARLATGYRPPLDPETYRKARRKGKIVAAAGLWFVALAVVPPLPERTIAFAPWLRVGYGIAGGLEVLTGLAVQWDLERFLQRQRVRAGEGLRARARIVRANNTGTMVNYRARRCGSTS